MEGAVASVIGRVVELLFTRITKELGYWVCSESKVNAMNEKKTQLNVAITNVEKVKAHYVGHELPPDVSTWLEEVEKIKTKAEKIPTNGIGCFNIMKRYKAGKDSSVILKNIDVRLNNIPHFMPISEKVLCKVDTKNHASTSSAPADDSTTGYRFKTRYVIFKKALECLESKNSKTQKIALCGMGGVGKTHMMELLKKAVEDFRMFYWIVKVAVGQNTDLIALQNAVAEQTGGALEETFIDLRASRLMKRFVDMSNDGEKKILVILDDLWKEVDLQQIGIPCSTLPDGFKLLITSREKDVCTKMRVHEDSVFKIDVLDDDEAKILFFETAGISKADYPHLYGIGEKIIKKCGNLPIALNIIATALQVRKEEESEWNVALKSLTDPDPEDPYKPVHEAFKLSFDFLRMKEEKAIFLLCGLFPDDSDIPIEELMKYAWGLKLLSKVNTTLAEARNKVQVCVNKLISANLLAKSDRVLGCVKMHDLARDFALYFCQEVKQASIVNNHDILKQRPQAKSFQRILLKCSGVTEFPIDFDYSDLAFLKLMDADEQIKLPNDFYKSMEKLEVLSYEGIHRPLVPESTNLRTLCLHGCKFTSDWSSITKLVQLEVLSFAGSGITELPSAIRNLKKLKLLDLTGCSADLCIDDGVLQGLVRLEELYIKASGHQAISFRKNVCEELKVISEKLSALQVEFLHKEDLPKNMSFPKLERFKISVGCLLGEDEDIYSFKNTLKLVTSSSELLESNINELFEKTEKLHLQVKDMEHLMDVTVPSLPCFSRLTELEISDCEKLTFLFPADVASGLTKLERLTVSSGHVLGTLIYGEGGGVGTVVMFPKLKILSLKKLPQLTSLCNTENRVELLQLVELILEGLPKLTSIYHDDAKQSFFNLQVAIPNLMKLKIYSMENLEQIWPCQISTGNQEMCNNNSTVRVVKVKVCDRLVNLFPTNPMPLLNKLEKLHVKECGSIDVLFNIDLGPPIDGDLAVQRSNHGRMSFLRGCWPWDRSVGEPLGLVTPPEENIDLGCGKCEEVTTSSLRSIRVEKLGKLKVLWRINGANNSPLLSCFQSVENIHIHGCKRFSNISTPTIPNFPPRARVDIRIQDSRDLVFNKALKSLEQDSKTRKIALCGVGNVGKTTLMEDLVEAANDLQMFNWVVKLVIGRESNVSDLPETTAKGIDEVLIGKPTKERAELLGRKFMQKSQGVKSKILVILDDLCQEMDLKDIGLPDPLPNGVKLLITSREENICSQMGVEKSSIFRVPLLGGPEAKALFYQTLRPSDGDAAAEELDKIAEDVVKICCGMPFLIKEIASLLENQKRSTWEDAYSNLKQNHLNLIYQKWYKELETEDAKAILLLSGFFPEEADIPVEDLVRYGWGLKLFSNTLPKARQLITNSVDVLIRANMLIRSDHVGCVKMHHPLRGFVFSNLTEVKQALIEHDNMPKDAKEPCERILLNCTGMSKFPEYFNYENVRFLKLMGEEKLLKFPDNFYGTMKNLEVVAYERMYDPLLPRYSTNLRTLCLDSCLLMGDFAFLGNLTSLEILSFAHCGIQNLPSTIGKLKRLKVLDVTGCADLSIDDGVFRGLDKLEELYLRVHGSKGVCFTNTNCDELKIRSLQLSALEVELYENIILQPKDLSYEKLKKFKISMGCLLDDIDIDPSENTLKLVSNISEVECKVSELFEKTERLYLQVKDMQNIEQVSMGYSFSNLKELEVSECADLMFLFTLPVASGFTELESLKVSSCPVLETLIHDESEICGSVITFPKLKFLSLRKLPCLTSLCDADNRVELPQLLKLILDGLPNFTTIFPDHEMQQNAFFNKQVVIPTLEILEIYSMKYLKQIWPCQVSTGSEEMVNNDSTVRVIIVKGCDSLVNLLPINPMHLLNRLEILQVKECGSVDVLFNIDLRSPSDGGKFEELTCSLRSIQVEKLGKLKVLWRINGANNSPLLSCFQSVENIHIHGCKMLRNISTPTIPNFPPRAHVEIRLEDSRDLLFTKALKSLEPDSKTGKIALCGVGNVGKTTLMEDLVEAAKDLRMFDSVVQLLIGRESNLFDLQETTAKCIDEVLKQNAIEERAKFLCQKFMQKSQGVKNKILVILDDLWQEMDLKDIGLPDPLPNGVMLLITSRDENVCSKMGVEKSSIFRVPLLGGPEAKVLFYQTLRPSDREAAAKELDKIAEDVVKICCGMPFLIKEIASLLENQKRSTWEDAYSNLKQNHLNSIYQKWYEKLETEDAKAILLLSGFFPEEADVPVEALVRYGWGLKLFNDEVDTLAKVRQLITNSVDVLIRANMLIQSNHAGCIKMHHPLRGFVFSSLTKVKQALIEDDNMPKEANEPYERILLNCTGMSKFPVDFNYKNVRLLKLMGEEKLLEFPDNFYGRMKNLEVVANERMNDPLLPRYSTNLRTLCLDSCSLMGDFPFLGDLTNLEILSFAHCSIQKLPSAIGKLKRLKVLDVTGCVGLSIDDDVFGDLDKLEELYLNGSEGVCFTATNRDELKIRSLQLSALEVELYKNMLQAKDLSFEKLKKFKISMGCLLGDIDIDPSKNTLKLVSNRSEVVECKVNELFEKTESLYLQVYDMQNIEQVSMGYSFCNLRELEVRDCTYLTFLFAVEAASALTKLERLEVSGCPYLETLIHGESGGGDGSMIKFPKLKYLYLMELPRLVSLCDTDNIRVELHQLSALEVELYKNMLQAKDLSFEKLKKFKISVGCGMNKYDFRCDSGNILKLVSKCSEVVECKVNELFDKTERLYLQVKDMQNIEQVSMGYSFSNLKGLEVHDCEDLTFLFEVEVASGLTKLERLEVSRCPVLETLIHGESTEGRDGRVIKFPKLKFLYLSNLPRLVSLCDKDNIRVELHQLVELQLQYLYNINSIFADDAMQSSFFNQRVQIPNIEILRIWAMEKLVQIWPAASCEIITANGSGSEKEEEVNNNNNSSSRLRKIVVWGCRSLENLFPRNPLPLKLG